MKQLCPVVLLVSLQLLLQHPQMGARPFTPTGGESTLLHSLKQWTDMASTQDTLELDIIRRQANDYVRGGDGALPTPAVSPIMGKSSLDLDSTKLMNINGNQDGTEANNKPWDHHNNLKDTYFTPMKGILLNCSGLKIKLQLLSIYVLYSNVD